MLREVQYIQRTRLVAMSVFLGLVAASCETVQHSAGIPPQPMHATQISAPVSLPSATEEQGARAVQRLAARRERPALVPTGVIDPSPSRAAITLPVTRTVQTLPKTAPAQATQTAGKPNFGDYSSETLATKAWAALAAHDHRSVDIYSGKSIELYQQRALDMQGALTSMPTGDAIAQQWALNDVATMYFIRAKSRAARGDEAGALRDFQRIGDQFSYAQAWDTKGWYWSMATAADDQMVLLGTDYDFGDYTSELMTTNAWGALAAGDHQGVDLYTTKSIEMYEQRAIEQQAALTTMPTGDAIAQQWALNDVATAYFIRAKSRAARGDEAGARRDFLRIQEQFGYAQAWDPKGWYWGIADATVDQIAFLGTDYDFGDYTSATLTVKAWEALAAEDYIGIQVYSNKCIDLYAAEARKQQSRLSDFEPQEQAFNPWALNDVATAHFILGKAYVAQSRTTDAKQAFQTIIDQYGFAQAWDPKGWFWKVAQAATKELAQLASTVATR